MGSVITLRSRWKDKEWEPEDGSPLGRPYSYTIDGVKHYVSKEEVEAGERVGVGVQGVGGFPVADEQADRALGGPQVGHLRAQVRQRRGDVRGWWAYGNEWP